ncbi:gamma-butyrobetaine dioxygenase-like [Saccoglossus kowalevskii]|uniref:Gamma-butyrobetaine dioxygenase-like n=1 Tax=Saccoglossus kowalevskii TaxID=10224 RepID=A0ABM0MJH3_SACKO|nr:PREDICTED: gamma-butyrobetaine dioxygenase-like [Saccoglossus kowalevskii]
MQSATNVDDERLVMVTFADGLQSKYPYIWLLDNCLCSKCYIHSANQRRLLFSQLDFQAAPESVTITADGANLTVTWSKEHSSDYTADWLRTHQFDSSKPDEAAEPHLNIWGAEMVNTIPTYNFESVMNDDAELYKWLNSLNTTGLALIKNVPRKVGQNERIANRVSYLRPTNYGVFFTVKSKMGASNAAYTTARLGLHTDLPFYDHTPGQCDDEGGVSEFTDGFKAALQLKEENPKAFKILTTSWLDFFDIGTDYYPYNLTRQATPIGLGRNGEVERIRYNQTCRSTMMRIPVEQVEAVYKALKAFDEILHHKDNIIQFKMESGDMVAFNNIRVLHGRSAFKIGQQGSRHLEGGYIDWDEIRSKLRVLKASLKSPLSWV